MSKPISWKFFGEAAVPPFTPADFCETLDGGQAFTWNKTEAFSESRPEYVGTFGDTAAVLRLSKSGKVECFLPANSPAKKLDEVSKYLDADRDYGAIRSSLSATKDPVVKKALEIYPTLRILRQNPSEAIVSFICSSSKRIVQIKQCVALLARNFGAEICGGFHSLPNFEKLAAADIGEIKKCKLGFRAGYLKKSAEKIVADSFDPETLRSAPYRDAKKYLTSLSGIGEKVADCILLFGAAKSEAFPVDTWIRQAMSELYETPDDPEKIREFAAGKFGVHAGYAQQLIFAAKRKNLL